MLVQLLLPYKLITLRYIWMVAIFSEWVVVVKRKISTYWATKRLSQVIKANLAFDSNTQIAIDVLYGWFQTRSIDPSYYFYVVGRSPRDTIMFVYKHTACDNLACTSYDLFMNIVLT
jgi:hypothetical protein